MSIGLVLIYLLSETLSVTRTGWVRANLFDHVANREAHAARILRQALATLQPPAPDGREHAVMAAHESLDFFTLPVQSRAGEGVMRARLAIEPEGGGRVALVLSLFPVDDTHALPKHALRRVLLSGLASARFSYYYAGPETVSVGQPRSDVAPELIVVGWTYPDDTRDVRELAVRPRVNLSGRCHLDPASGTCRAS